MKTQNLVGILFLVGIAVIITLRQSEVPNESQSSIFFKQYSQYMQRFNKPMLESNQFIYRLEIFKEYLKAMNKHNSDETKKWKMGINQFSDLTQQEFQQMYMGELDSGKNVRIQQQQVNVGYIGEVDWRTKGIITAVKNQGKCGSCWAFAATAAHQSYQVQVKRQPNTISLSEQQLVDCSNIEPYFNNGCNGGYGVRALEFIKDFGQLPTSEYPYTATTGTCLKQKGSFSIMGVSEMTGCDSIDREIHRRPMAVRVDATNWKSYSSGIFDDCVANINHAVFLVGSNDQAWIIKNSWSDTWGEKGFIRLKKGNTCGVCVGPSFPM